MSNSDINRILASERIKEIAAARRHERKHRTYGYLKLIEQAIARAAQKPLREGWKAY